MGAPAAGGTFLDVGLVENDGCNYDVITTEVNVNTKIVRIGNSRGVRIPRPLLDEAGLDGGVRLSVTEAGILIEPLSAPREGWGEAATHLRGQGDAGLLDVPLPTDWDESEWVWE